MAKLVISYRRLDAAGTAGRICDRLVSKYGRDSVFMDVDNIPFGTDFREHIRSILVDSSALLVVIGPRWLGVSETGQSRIVEEDDPVRVEVETALKNRIAVIPVLVDGAGMPKALELPDGLKDFVFLNAAEVNPGRDFHQHMDRLIRFIDGMLAKPASPTPGARPGEQPASPATDTSARVEVEVHAPAAPPPPPREQPPRSEAGPLLQPSFREFFLVWLKIGCVNFGGPAGQIAMMHRIVVDEKKWVEETRFLHALNFSMLLPGPEAQKLATYIGWMLHGVRGGLTSGILFILPGALVMLGLSLLYAVGRGVALIDSALFGIKAAVLVIVVEALIRIGKRALKTSVLVGLAAFAFVGIFFFALPFPLIVIVAALIGYLVAQSAPERLGLAEKAPIVAEAAPGRWKQMLSATIIGLVAWWVPVLLVALTLGPDHILVQIGTFFSKLAVVSFGGAYALLAYMAQQVVETHGWMTAPEMVDGLGLAETTPGPLILVTQFVGFLAAYRDAAPFSPVAAGILGAIMTTWVTFVPPMMLTFAAAPFIEQLRSNQRLSGALAAITAAVVGVILNLSVWFALHVLFGTVTETHAGLLRWFAFDPLALDLRASALAVIAAVLAFGLHRGLIEVVAVMAALGVALQLVLGA